MRGHFIKGLCKALPSSILCKIILTGSFCLAFADPLLAAPKSDLHELRGRIESLKKDVENAEESRNEAADALKQSEQAISKISRNLHELDQQQQEAKQAIDKLNAQNRQTQGSIRALQAQLAQLVYQEYVTGQENSLTTLLNQRDPNEIARQLHYFTYIARARADLIRNLKADLTQLQSITQRTQEKNVELTRIKDDQAAQRRQLQLEQASRKDVLARISKQIEGQRKQISHMQQDEKRLTRLVEQLSKVSAKRQKKATEPKLRISKVPDASQATGPFLALKGKLNLPVLGELTNRFGTPREDSGALWKGLFIKAPNGQPVKAVASGRVVFADWLRGFGNLIIVAHDDSYMSLYGNNESLYKQVGDAVRAGDTIATVGNSGGNPHAGLYFELRYQSKPFDPLTWVH